MSKLFICIAIVLCAASHCPVLRAQDGEPGVGALPSGYTLTPMSPAKRTSWLGSWSTAIIADSSSRFCDTASGEDLGWLVRPFLTGYYNGYLATGDANWVGRLVNWTDALVRREVPEPDGYVGWPMFGGAETTIENLNSYDMDSMAGEAMAFTPIVLMARTILDTPALNARYGAKAQSYIDLAKRLYGKWQNRGGWRTTSGGGGIALILPYGIDPNLNKWTSLYAQRNNPAYGFSYPENLNNEIGQWSLAMYDATGDANYKAVASRWYTLMKSRMTPQSNGTYAIWNYWQPGGPWDYDPNTGATKHWIGTHPNDGYYQIDVRSIVDAYEHGVVFTLGDIQRLVATDLANGKLWSALAPYNPQIQAQFEASLDPSSWGAYMDASWYLAIQQELTVPEPASLTLLAAGGMVVALRRRKPRVRPR
jgi:hypothetical protein